MKHLLLALGSIGMLITPLFAEDYKIPKKDSLFTISFPEKWTITHDDDSVDAITEDGGIQLNAKTDDKDSLKQSVSDAIDYLTEAGVAIKAESQKEKDGEINGMKIGGISWDGTDSDEPCRVSLSFIDIGNDKVITLLYWGSTEAEKTHGKDLEEILKSMKPLKTEAKPAEEKEPKKAEPEETKEEKKEEKEEKEAEPVKDGGVEDI